MLLIKQQHLNIETYKIKASSQKEENAPEKKCPIQSFFL